MGFPDPSMRRKTGETPESTSLPAEDPIPKKSSLVGLFIVNNVPGVAGAGGEAADLQPRRFAAIRHDFGRVAIE